MGLAPGHDRLAAETRAAADDDLGLGPARANLPDDALQFLDTAGRGIDVGSAQPRAQQVLAAEDVQRELAVTAIVPVKEAPLLMAVDGIIGGFQVEPDLLGRPPMGLQKAVHGQAVHPPGVGHDLLVTRLAIGIGWA